MAFGSWSPFRREDENNNLPTSRRGNGSSGTQGLSRLQNEMNRMFDEFFSSSGPSLSVPSQFFGDYSPSQFVPRMDISEADNMLKVSAELPGMTADDIEINCERDRLQIRGEKRQEETEQEEGYYRTERSFGRFERTIPLPEDVDVDKAEANFKNGVLTVQIPKTGDKETGRKLDIKTE